MAVSGQFAARSGGITDGQSTSLKLIENCREGTGSFAVRVSSEAGFDTLTFYLNASRLGRWSGEVAWTNFAFAVTAGTNTFEWRYTKDPTKSSAGLDAAFLDNLDLPLVVLLDASSPAHLSLTRLLSGFSQLRVLGQTNQLYVIQASDDLRSWSALTTNTAASGLIRFQDTASSQLKLRFYRAIVP